MPTDITKELLEAMTQYTDEVKEEIGQIINDVAKEAKSDVRSGSPVRTGAYRKSWAVSFDKKKSGNAGFTVYAKAPHYRLTHLLEDGHKTKNGGKTKAQPHIRQVQDWADKEALKRIEEAIKK